MALVVAVPLVCGNLTPFGIGSDTLLYTRTTTTCRECR